MALTPALLDKELTFSTFKNEFDADNEFFQVAYTDVDEAKKRVTGWSGSLPNWMPLNALDDLPAVAVLPKPGRA